MTDKIKSVLIVDTSEEFKDELYLESYYDFVDSTELYDRFKVVAQLDEKQTKKFIRFLHKIGANGLQSNPKDTYNSFIEDGDPIIFVNSNKIVNKKIKLYIEKNFKEENEKVL